MKFQNFHTTHPNTHTHTLCILKNNKEDGGKKNSQEIIMNSKKQKKKGKKFIIDLKL